jgi:hypothetical protein
MEGEKSALRYAVVLPVIFFNIFTIHSLTEGNYIYEVLKLRRLSGIFNNILIHNKVRFAPFFICTLNSILSIMKKYSSFRTFVLPIVAYLFLLLENGFNYA